MAFALSAAMVGALCNGTGAAGAAEPSEYGRIAGGGTLRIPVPEAVGGKTVIGQLTVDRVLGSGYVTAYGCDDGPPLRSDLNFDSNVSGAASNRLIVKADNDGELCLFTSRPAAIIVDINAVTFDTGVTSFANRRTDTRSATPALLPAGGVLRVSVPEAIGRRTVVGQLTADRATGTTFVTAYGCDDGIPTDGAGGIGRSDLNASGRSPVASNRLIVQADANGEVCLRPSAPVALIVDVNGVSDSGIVSFANRRTDTRSISPSAVAPGSVVPASPVPEAEDERRSSAPPSTGQSEPVS